MACSKLEALEWLSTPRQRLLEAQTLDTQLADGVPEWRAGLASLSGAPKERAQPVGEAAEPRSDSDRASNAGSGSDTEAAVPLTDAPEPGCPSPEPSAVSPPPPPPPPPAPSTDFASLRAEQQRAAEELRQTLRELAADFGDTASQASQASQAASAEEPASLDLMVGEPSCAA